MSSRLAPEASSLIEEIRQALAANANSERAVQQQRYMKSEMPYWGLTTPILRATVKPIISAHPLPDAANWNRVIKTLYDQATHREERYAALAIARATPYRAWARDPASLGLYEHLIRTGAWWDLVDETAHLVGDLLTSHRRDITPLMREWATDPDLWIRRVSIICQLGSKTDTDTVLLHDAITGSLADDNFFARKAIGWALRQYARTDPAWVVNYCAELGQKLSPLSHREALKHLG